MTTNDFFDSIVKTRQPLFAVSSYEVREKLNCHDGCVINLLSVVAYS